MRWTAPSAVSCVLIALVLFGCGKAQTRAEDHRARADRYIEEGKLAEATLELRNLTRLDAQNPDVFRKLAEVLLRQNQPSEAFREYLNVVSLAPEDLDARLHVTTFYLLGGHPEDALPHAQKAVELAPDRFQAHALLAKANAGLKKFQEAAQAAAKAIELAPENEALRLQLSGIELSRGNPARAEAALREAVKAIPSSVALQANLAKLLASQKRFPEADALMAQVLKSRPDDPGARRVVAWYRLARRDLLGAEVLLLASLAQAGEDGAKRRAALEDLASFYQGTGNLTKATQTLENLRADVPEDVGVLARLAGMHLLAEELEKAKPLVKRILAGDGEHLEGRLLQARIDLAEGRTPESRAALQKLVLQAPNSVNAHLFLGKAYATEREWEKAKAEYERVLEQVPGHFFASLDLAKVYVFSGRPREALQPLEAVLRGRPDHPVARQLRADALLSASRFAEAQIDYDWLLKRSPGDASFALGLAQALEGQGKTAAALQQYEVARRGAPEAVEPALRYVGLLGKLGKTGEAEAAGNAFLRENGDRPLVLNALARLAVSKEKLEAAEGYLRRSLAVDPDSPATREIEAQILLHRGDEAGARRVVEGTLRAEPERISSLLLLASLAEKQGRADEARGLYERVLKLSPRDAVAANNLAMLYREDPLKLAEALSLAQLAVEERPRDPAALDTLGWVQLRMGAVQTALQSLEEARRLWPKNPEIAYHLAVASRSAGKTERARSLLKEALAAPQQGPWAPDAAAALRELEQSAKK
jgi:cellulose synthase operon protein C